MQDIEIHYKVNHKHENETLNSFWPKKKKKFNGLDPE